MTGSEMRFCTFSHTTSADSTFSILLKTITNSSPPKRHTKSSPLICEARTVATICSNTSPTLCPWASLIFLKSSTSNKITQKPSLNRLYFAIARRKCSFSILRLARPVNSSYIAIFSNALRSFFKAWSSNANSSANCSAASSRISNSSLKPLRRVRRFCLNCSYW